MRLRGSFIFHGGPHSDSRTCVQHINPFYLNMKAVSMTLLCNILLTFSALFLVYVQGHPLDETPWQLSMGSNAKPDR